MAPPLVLAPYHTHKTPAMTNHANTPATSAPAITAPAITAPAITARGLTLTLGGQAGTTILRGIDLDVPAGQVLALLGPSGSGKSSLMAVLSGLEKASGGQLCVAGQDFMALSEDALAAARRGRIGVVLQAFHLLPTMTALDNVATALELAGVRGAAAKAQASAELEAVGLGHRLHHYPAQLSGGEQQRVAIARALAPRPQLIFADEPTGNLDATTGADIMALMLSRRAQTGASLVLITHDEALARRAQRILRLADGRVVADTLV
jgi:putative ABC transport system ATP-binding protein